MAPGYDRDGRSVAEWTAVETEVWEPDAERPGYLRKVRTKTVREVYEELREALFTKDGGFYYATGCDEYFGLGPAWRDAEEWPEGRVAVFVVTGGSEGHYIHVEVERLDGTYANVMLGKTFDGWDAAWAFAKRVGEVLGV